MWLFIRWDQKREYTFLIKRIFSQVKSVWWPLHSWLICILIRPLGAAERGRGGITWRKDTSRSPNHQHSVFNVYSAVIMSLYELSRGRTASFERRAFIGSCRGARARHKRGAPRGGVTSQVTHATDREDGSSHILIWVTRTHTVYWVTSDGSSINRHKNKHDVIVDLANTSRWRNGRFENKLQKNKEM